MDNTIKVFKGLKAIALGRLMDSREACVCATFRAPFIKPASKTRCSIFLLL